MQSSKEIADLLSSNWESIMDTVRTTANISSVAYETWILPCTFFSYNDNTVTVMISNDNDFILNYINSHYKDFFKVAISEFLGDTIVNVSFALKKDIINNEETLSDTDSESDDVAGFDGKSDNYGTSNLNNKYTFDTFVVGKNNEFAYSASLAVAESPGNSYNPLFLYGGPGLGKTHLMHSIGHYIMEHNNNAKVLYVTSEQFTNEVIESIRSSRAAAENMAKLRDKYRTVDVLMVDDVQFIIGKESTQEEFFHTFNALHQAGKQIVLSSDRHPKEMETLEERFRSRFEMGLIADISSPDYETRVAILRKNAESYGKKIDDDVLNYIANNIKFNIRELEGALTQVLFYSKLRKVDITLDSTKEALKDIISPDSSKVITPQLIIDTVCEQYGIKKEEIVSKKRVTEVVIPRQVVMYLCREFTDASLDEIGRLLGKKDHTTVMNGHKQIKSKLMSDEDLSKNVDIIVKKINPSL